MVGLDILYLFYFIIFIQFSEKTIGPTTQVRAGFHKYDLEGVKRV